MNEHDEATFELAQSFFRAGGELSFGEFAALDPEAKAIFIHARETVEEAKARKFADHFIEQLSAALEPIIKDQEDKAIGELLSLACERVIKRVKAKGGSN